MCLVDTTEQNERQSFRLLEKGGETYGYNEIGGDRSVGLSVGLAGRDPGDATGTQRLMGRRVRMDDDDGAFALWLYIGPLGRACADRRVALIRDGGLEKHISHPVYLLIRPTGRHKHGIADGL